jgi:RNA polymerase sigma-70 factor (ECF subfamily)
LQVADWHPDPERLYQQAELRYILHTGLLRLRPTLRVVFVLRDIEGLSIAETATILNLAPGAVKVRLHRARLELRDTLTRYFRITNSVRTLFNETSLPPKLGREARE